jgi:hypothetical protein
MPPPQEELLARHGIVPLERDVRRMTREELEPHFAAKSSGRILLGPLIRSTIWQAKTRIEEGREPPISGNLRTFWYRWVKPVLAHIPDDDTAKTDPYDTMLEAFTDLVLELGLFHYRDLDFTDESWENRRIGTTRPEVLVFAEKTGWVRFLRDIHDELGVSTLALGGAPSALTSEYTARDILDAIGGTGPVQLIGIVDYDPSGAIIANAFQTQLAKTGLPDTTSELLIHPAHYSGDEIEIFRYPLPTHDRTKNIRWLERTGGIDGLAYGLEAESMPLERVKNLVRVAVTGAEDA